MMRAYRLAYDGRPFYGFQRQPDVPTVEDALFDALRDLDVLDPEAAKPGGYAAAGRTDAGVSARAQTVAFDAPEWLSPAALNAELPASVRAWASADVPADFHATHHARARTYVYYLYAPSTVDERRQRDENRDFDDDLARETLDRLTGEHDFHNLTTDDDGTVRDLDAGAEREGDVLFVRLRAGGFARQLVRRIVGLVTEIADGNTPLSKVDRVLAPEPLDGPEGVAPAPAEPLVLWDVEYGDGAAGTAESSAADGMLDFEVDPAAAESARGVFGSRHREFQTAARVAGGIRDGIEER